MEESAGPPVEGLYLSPISCGGLWLAVPLRHATTRFDKISKEKQKALDEFWKRNPWAKEKFSIATKKGWEYLNSLKTRYKEKYTYNLYPSQIRKDLEEYAKKYYPDKEFVSGEAIIYSNKQVKKKYAHII